MTILVDTSVLGRLANRADASHSLAKAAVAELHRRGEILHVTPQNLIEFRNFATRPVNVNGLGLTASAADGLHSTFETTFTLLEEIPAIFPAWKAIVTTLGVIGKQVHDARLIAVCHAHGVSHLLTLNVSHFVRIATVGPGVVGIGCRNRLNKSLISNSPLPQPCEVLGLTRSATRRVDERADAGWHAANKAFLREPMKGRT